jgi:hypothetical protein
MYYVSTEIRDPIITVRDLVFLNRWYKKKSEAVPLHAMKAHGGRGGI